MRRWRHGFRNGDRGPEALNDTELNDTDLNDTEGMTADVQIAQCNIARLRAPLDSPEIADFVGALEPMNRLAEESPGFVWRLQTEAGDATAISAFDDEALIINLTVWETIEALSEFTYRSAHRDVLRRRGEWFETAVNASLVLWWIARGTTPSVEDAQARLALLRRDGPTADAFTFRTVVSP